MSPFNDIPESPVLGQELDVPLLPTPTSSVFGSSIFGDIPIDIRSSIHTSHVPESTPNAVSAAQETSTPGARTQDAEDETPGTPRDY